MTTTNRDKSYLPSDIDMTSPNDNNKELQNSDNVLSIPSVSPSTNSANTNKQKMKATGMRTRGRGTPVGQGAYIMQRKLKIRGGSIQSKNFYTEHPPTTASTPSIITPHSSRGGGDRQMIPVMIAHLYLLNTLVVVKRVVKNL